SSRLNNSLPGVLHLYIGMEVILKHRNLYIELGILNGAKGVLRKLVLSKDLNGLTYCKVAIVEFCNSKAKLEGLPPGFFPIQAQRWKSPIYITNERRERVLVMLDRFQLPIEPAFALTGQSAQGYSFNSIVCSLSHGGFQAYVAASRATSRQGLFITKPI
ncbi:hypothetical protein FB446DRAFT_626396, partial [Lentinula raphanica]